ncbi:hypothetical protein [Tychonema sp. LEGE 07203]|uniref:hypothetical protein n=1 Tax=Tychonema sp. LEGE 07203 TaxID=1828671 RepID=UPI001882466E|nr:hypothetical protein [Tychonema sp. LEGE 07203]
MCVSLMPLAAGFFGNYFLMPPARAFARAFPKGSYRDPDSPAICEHLFDRPTTLQNPNIGIEIDLPARSQILPTLAASSPLPQERHLALQPED